MNYSSVFSNVSVAFLAQGISLCLSAVTSLLVPKVLGVEEFGYWQLFLFYTTYTAFFHLGINDGLYLINGGKTRAELNSASIAGQFRLATAFQLVVACAITLLSLQFENGYDRRMVLFAVAVYTPIYNASGFLGYLFQAVNETKLYSLSTIIDRVVFLLPLTMLLLFQIDSFEWYVLSYCFSKLVSLGFCLWMGREFVFSAALPFAKTVCETKTSITVGFKLLLANLASAFILGVMRLTVDAAWDIEAFGQVSFSLTIVNFFMVFVNQVGMVLFPELRRVSKEEQHTFFRHARQKLTALLPAVYLLYYPVKELLAIWLPQYELSVFLMIFLLPACVFDGKMNLLGTTYLKVLRKEGLLLSINAITVLAASAGVLAGAYLAHSLEWVVLASSFAIAGRSVFTEHYVAKQFCDYDAMLVIWEIVISVAFVLISCLFSGVEAFLTFSGIYLTFFLFLRSKKQNAA